MNCKPNAPRAEHELELTVGEVLEDEKGKMHVFIGWRTNSAGQFPVFVEMQDGSWARDAWASSIFIYHAAITDTLCRKFPALASRRGGSAGSSPPL